MKTRKFNEDHILIATHNIGKLQEIEQLFAPFGVNVIGASEMNLPEPEETETTFVGNAQIKARSAVIATRLPALADDSGIEIDGLDGAPGVYTADWAEAPNGRDFKIAMERTYRELKSRNVPQPWTARFCSTLVLAWPDGHEEIFEGWVEGTLVWPTRGVEGHGYDPMFQPLGEYKTFGEMTFSEKNSISHRTDSFRKLIASCFD